MKNENKNILHLNLYKMYFDMILNEFKNIEYRQINIYWNKKLSGFNNDKKFKKFDKIIFSNGYAKNRRQFEIEHIKTRFEFGKCEFGANPTILYFALHLGKIINKKNC